MTDDAMTDDAMTDDAMTDNAMTDNAPTRFQVGDRVRIVKNGNCLDSADWLGLTGTIDAYNWGGGSCRAGAYTMHFDDPESAPNPHSCDAFYDDDIGVWVFDWMIEFEEDQIEADFDMSLL